MRTLFLAGTLSVFSTLCVAQTYDVVILNGRVMDPETGFDQIANVGVSNGWITAITDEEIDGSETIDATGHVVAPGFIDLEQHGLDPWGIKVNLRDGVTTQMDFEVGAANIDEWYKARQGATQANYGTVVGQEFARMRVHDGLVLEGGDIDFRNFFALRAKSVEDGVEGWSSVPSNREQMNEITSQLDEGLRLGALGVGSTIGYARKGITTYEMFEAQRAAARYGRLTSVHHRFHPSASTPTETQTGVNEILVNAMVLGAPLHIQHDNDYGWWENQEKLQMARDQGYNVWSSFYPWTAGSGNYGASIIAPENWEGSMGYKYEDTIFDPQLDRFVTKDEFLTFAENEPGRTAIVFSPPREQWLNDWITIAGYGISGDGMAGLDIEGNLMSWDAPYEDYAGHPRSAGSHALVLRLAREANVPLMLTLTQLSYIHAKRLGDTGLRAMQVRGRLQEGMVADITIFDPETVTEKANYTLGQQGLPSEGIPYVLVNGTLVVKNSEVQRDVYAGQPIRFPVEEKGRFIPAGREQIMGILTPDTGTARPTLLEDITNSEANLAPVAPPSNQYALVEPTDPFDWFTPRIGLNDSALFFCVVHARFEDRATVKRDYAKAMMARTGGFRPIQSE
ncbi:amidohydrolase family protein [Ruegeria sp. HKCCD6109]|uniref:amidohydrolase family protein n=1 Tax=Ruegeria sp. HKCCD6109 TaxID=2683017 RepID=UPI00149316FE|nr:amidohydrolase family protein [Ruegeria sp. HKCCD6109]NOD62393.1 aminoacylase [Ruegeria sp. HKCCD6109]